MQAALDFLVQADPVFAQIIATYGVPEIPKRPPGFATLALLILEQQVSIDSARATFGKLNALVPEFEPNAVLSLTDEQFRAAGVSRQKTRYIKGLSSAILDDEIDLDILPQKSEAEIRETLIALKGIGHWTIDVYLLFCLGAPDVMPLGDIAIVNTIRELHGLEHRGEMEALAQTWSPHRSVATFLLWHHYLSKRNRVSGY